MRVASIGPSCMVTADAGIVTASFWVLWRLVYFSSVRWETYASYVGGSVGVMAEGASSDLVASGALDSAGVAFVSGAVGTSAVAVSAL